MQSFIQIGVISKVHGLKGEVGIFPTTDDPKRFNKLKEVYLSDHAIESKRFNEKDMMPYSISTVRFHKHLVLLTFECVTTIDEAERLKGKLLIINRKDAIILEKDEYFISDLIGCRVFDEKYGYLGELTDVMSTGSNDVYIVKGEKYGEVLIPALKNVILGTDIENARIDTRLLDGLIDD